MRTFIRSAALAVTLTFAAFAAPFAFTASAAEAAEKPAPTLADMPGGKYTLDKSHANIIFSINHLGFSYYKGRFNDFDATLFYDAKDASKSAVKVTVDIASIDTNNSELEGKLKSDKFFDAAKFPVATFTSTKFVKTSEKTGKLTGDLSLHGVTRPVTLDVTLQGVGENPYSKKSTLGFSGTTTIKRSEFGVTEYVPYVGDDVTLTIDAEFGKAD